MLLSIQSSAPTKKLMKRFPVRERYCDPKNCFMFNWKNRLPNIAMRYVHVNHLMESWPLQQGQHHYNMSICPIHSLNEITLSSGQTFGCCVVENYPKPQKLTLPLQAYVKNISVAKSRALTLVESACIQRNKSVFKCCIDMQYFQSTFYLMKFSEFY